MPPFLDRLARAAGFARPALATKAAPANFALYAEGRATWTPCDPAALARAGYQRNPVVYRSVRLIAEAAASLPLTVVSGEGRGLLELLRRPNPRESGAQFLETVYADLMLAGVAYIEAVSVDGRVAGLQALRPDRMRMVPGPDGWPAAYVYTAGGRTRRFECGEGALSPILAVSLFHPSDDHGGLPPIVAAAGALDIHNAAAAWNKALLDNAARPSGALVFAGASLSDTQFDRLKEELEANYQGAGNAGRPLLLEGGLDWKRLEAKALSAGSGPDGGYLAPDSLERTVLQRLATLSPIRAIASVQQISGGQYKRAVSVGAPATGWVAETAARPTTDAPTLSQLAFPAAELYAMPAATQTLLDDAVVDIEAWLAGEVETAFAEQEGIAFVTGNGQGRPKGFLASDTVANASWAPGKLGIVGTGSAGTFAASNPADVLFDLVYALRAAYRQNARFVMNRRTQSAIRKFKDADGNYLWQPPLAADRAATLMGFPVTEAEAMPDVANGSLSVAFGDFRRGYLIVDRTGLRVLRDPYSAKPYVLFYTTKRVGGGVQDFDAIKLLKFA